MYDFHLYSDLRKEAKALGWKDVGIIGGPGLTGVELPLKGGDYTILIPKNMKSARNTKADLLALDFENLVFDTVLGKQFEFVEFDLHSIIFGRRPQAIANFRKALSFARFSKNKILVSTRAKDEFELRTPGDLKSLLKSLGMTNAEASKCLKDNPKAFYEMVQERKGEDYIVKGVKKK